MIVCLCEIFHVSILLNARILTKKASKSKFRSDGTAREFDTCLHLASGVCCCFWVYLCFCQKQGAVELPRSPAILEISRFSEHRQFHDLAIFFNDGHAFLSHRVEFWLRVSEQARSHCPDHRSGRNSVIFRRIMEIVGNTFGLPRVNAGWRFSEQARKTIPMASVVANV